MGSKVLLVDFDGVIHKSSSGFLNGDIYDDPTDNCLFTINNLIKAGYKIVIFTARERQDYKKIKEWLKLHRFPELEITNKKITALAYIDDRAIRFTSWPDIVHYFI